MVMFSTVPYGMAIDNNLRSEDWARAALRTIARSGVDQLSVEGLARELGVTKGSFYWHFAGRSALISGALDLWEREGTLVVVESLQRIEDPKERLRALYDVSLGDVNEGRLDGALAVRIDDPIVGPVVRRVTERRIAFLERLFRDLGLTPGRARIRARITYSAYVGHFQILRAMPDDRDLSGPSAAYNRDLIATFTAP